VWSKPCKRPECSSPIVAPYPSWLADRGYCSPACRRLDATRAAAARPSRVYVPAPSNNVHHRKIQQQQLELIRLELDRLRAARKVDAA
jgi:hypothetical protein